MSVVRTGIEPLTVSLRDVCFLHWPVDTEHADTLLPDWLRPDTFDGTAWISVLPLTMATFDLFELPVRDAVDAVTLRTYVESPSGERGVYFLSLDVTDRLAAETARRAFRLPYYAAKIDRSTSGSKTTVRAVRRVDSEASLDVTYEPTGPTQTASPDTLASFLAERYRYFTEGPLGTGLVGSVGHEAWELQSATAAVSADGLLATEGVDVSDERPLAHYSEGTKMRIGPPGPLSMSE